MMETFFSILFMILGIYVLAGVIFAIIFVFRGGVGKIDPSAEGASIWFRLIILPGMVALWPAFIKKWLS